MEERDLSVLSFRELIQMLDVILLPLHNYGDGGVEKQMQKSKIEEELKNVEEQLKSGAFLQKRSLKKFSTTTQKKS